MQIAVTVFDEVLSVALVAEQELTRSPLEVPVDLAVPELLFPPLVLAALPVPVLLWVLVTLRVLATRMDQPVPLVPEVPLHQYQQVATRNRDLCQAAHCCWEH